MPTLYHAPNSRSSRVIAQLMLMGKLDAVDVVIVEIVKHDGSGRRDPNNAHPEGKVPYLVTDEGEHIRESAAIMMYLDELFGQPLSPRPGQPGRGSYLTWMAYSGGVMEPALVAHFSGIDHPALVGTFRTMVEVGAQLEVGLEGKGFLLGDSLSVADLLMASAFQWAPHLMPEIPTVKAWVQRVSDALDNDGLQSFESEALSGLEAA
ncbi:glutathione S-transferase family protein [Pseudophaeobacter sp.]|uniref:glutathione S-transferase family protein n=1 Tax=Pseudophaeobacter sp. TaxID=1971739 RepID=UPI0032990104